MGGGPGGPRLLPDRSDLGVLTGPSPASTCRPSILLPPAPVRAASVRWWRTSRGSGGRVPEGDTVFFAAHQLREALAGRVLTSGEFRHPRLATVDPAGWRVSDVVPVGKHLLLRFDNDRTLHHHLRMDGEWRVYRPEQRWRGPGHEIRAVLRCPEHVAVGYRLHDLALLRRVDEARVVGHLGPDVLADEWDQRSEAEVLRRMPEHAPLGVVLLDQRVVAGIGNVYLAETCFRAGVSPFTPVAELDQDTRLTVLRTARDLMRDNRYNPARTTTGDRRPGRRHWVYQRAGAACRRCGALIRDARLGTPPRRTWFCPRCQPSPEAR